MAIASIMQVGGTIMSTIFGMIIFAFSMSISPGPVNLIILSSGINNGLKNTLSFISGATIGSTLLLFTIGLGLHQIIESYPVLLKVMTVAGASFIVYMGYSTIISTEVVETRRSKEPRFIDGFMLQWLNPKAWIACISGSSLFIDPNSVLPLFTFSCVYFLICFCSLIFWGYVGSKIQIFLNNSFKLGIFNKIMGVGLICVAIFLMKSQFIDI